MRSVVIGLPGCSWDLLERLLDTGELPNIARLRDESARGILESTIPFFSGPAWASFATGASPAAHGVYDLLLPLPDGQLQAAGQTALRRRTYFQQLGAEGKRSVLINFPLDHDGCEGAVIVNSSVTDDDRRRILPLGRRERYRRLLDAYVTFPGDPSNVDELCAMERARFDLARELFLGESWDHFFVLFSATDLLAHQAAGSLLAGDGDALQLFLRLYRDIDRYVGWLADRAPEALVAVVSDHGQTEEKAVLRINALLAGLGFVEVAKNGSNGRAAGGGRSGAGARLRIYVPPPLARLRSAPAVGPAATFATKALRRGLSIHVTRATYVVDRASSRAFSPTDASFAVYARDVGASELAAIRESLLELRLPDGEPAVAGVWTPEELYGRIDGEGPALLFAPAPGVRPSAAIRDSVVDPAPVAGRGCHDRDGIVMLSGDGVRKGDLGRRSIYDLAPTLLWAMGSAVLADGSGEVLLDAFAPEARRRPVNEADASVDVYRAGNRESEEVARRLRAFGYI